jgi:hypothetical protein
MPEPSISVFDAPDSSISNRVYSGFLIPCPGSEWKVIICTARERPGEERNSGGVMYILSDGGRTNLGPAD